MLTNPNSQDLQVTPLNVAVAGTNHAGCTAQDFAAVPYTGSYPLVVPGRSSRSLSALGIATAGWPRIAMVDRPVNQDACKNATITFTLTGSGHS